MSSQIRPSDPRRLAVGVVLAAIWAAGDVSLITAQIQSAGRAHLPSSM